MDSRLSDYIREAKSSGMDERQIKKELVGAGWPILDVEEAMEKSGPIHPSRIRSKASIFWRKFIIIFFILSLLGGTAFGFWYVDQKIQSAKPNISFEETSEEENLLSGQEEEASGASALGESSSSSLKIAEMPDGYQLQNVYFSPNGASVILIVKKLAQEFIFINGQIGKGYDDITGCRFNGSGSHFFCIAAASKKKAVLIDGQEGKQYDSLIKNPVFSPNGEVLAYVAGTGLNKILVLSGQEKPFPYNLSGDLVFSSDSEYLAYIVSKDSSKFLVVNDQELQIEQGAFFELFFSADNKKIFYGAKENSDIYWKSADIQ
ncbi:MAG: hypothetical protein WCX23_02955 [Candidatus Paceibacterota bacterium]|jgi:hypothetical protein